VVAAGDSWNIRVKIVEKTFAFWVRQMGRMVEIRKGWLTLGLDRVD
jgi:hypothetical protein